MLKSEAMLEAAIQVSDLSYKNDGQAAKYVIVLIVQSYKRNNVVFLVVVQTL